jgi:GNAT superfamily N-acetyltransferase
LSQPQNLPQRQGGGPADIVFATIDQLSTIRFIHAQSLRTAALSWAADEDIAAFVAHAYTPAYVQQIEASIVARRFLAATVNGRLVGTCAWQAVEDERSVARIRWNHVLPMFGRMGIGRHLLRAVETAAEDEGQLTFVARALPHAVRFYETAGYGITAHGSRSVAPDRTLPVTYLRKSLRAPVSGSLL